MLLIHTLYKRHRGEERRPYKLHLILLTVETIPQPDTPGQVEELGDPGEDVPTMRRSASVSRSGES